MHRTYGLYMYGARVYCIGAYNYTMVRCNYCSGKPGSMVPGIPLLEVTDKVLSVFVSFCHRSLQDYGRATLHQHAMHDTSKPTTSHAVGHGAT